MKWWTAALLLLVAACGAEQTTMLSASETAVPGNTTTTSTTTTSAPTTSVVPVEPLSGYRFTMAVSVAPDGGTGTTVARLDGVADLRLPAQRIFGDLHGEPLDLLTDGTQWWDLNDPDLQLTADDILFFLGANGFLQPEQVTGLLADTAAWQEIGKEQRSGAPVTHLRRTDVVKGLDWDYGDLAVLDVWRTSDGEIVELIARWATGDNEGFPTSTWQITERNPEVSIPAPPS